jgi:hypothetical protein
MRIHPNKTILEGVVKGVVPAADGWGAHVQFSVDRSSPAEGFDDFLRAQPGTVVEVFAAEPEGLSTGKSYVLVASVLGGPGGQRIVLENVRAQR